MSDLFDGKHCHTLVSVPNPAPGEAAPIETEDVHNWSDSPDIVIREPPVTKVYLNGYDQVVIRQAGGIYDEDPFVFFTRENIPALIASLQKAIAT